MVLSSKPFKGQNQSLPLLKDPPYTWKYESMTIGTFLTKAPNIDCFPIGQRPDVDSLDKKQGIIAAIFEGHDICEIAIREMKKILGYDYAFRSVDGGHRKRSIKEFVNGEFKTGKGTKVYVDGEWVDISGMHFRQLDKKVQQIFRNYRLRFVVYDENMTDRQAGEVFRLRNKTTDVNHQEMLNSYENNLVAVFVRESARKISGLPNEPHDLFERLAENKDGVKHYKYIESLKKRLGGDTVMSRILCIISKGEGVTTSSDSEIEDMWVRLGDEENGIWARESKQIQKDQKLVIKILDFIVNYARCMKASTRTKLKETEITILVRYFITMNKFYGETGWKIDNWDKFFMGFKKTYESFHKDNLPKRLTTLVYGERTIAEAFKGHLGVFNTQFKINNSIKWFFDEMKALKLDYDNLGIIFVDKKRNFSQRERLQKWLDQDGKCAVTGENLSFQDSVSGHIKAHSKGGKTQVNNLAVIHKDKNVEMGTMDLDQYIHMK